MNREEREKYSRQILFAGLGEAGQESLLGSSAVLAGCGAIGTVVANLLVRSGVGRLRIIDRDFVEPSNLQRQTLFEESDARDSLPKAVAAERRLRAVNSGVAVEGMVADLTADNARELLSGFPLILDGTDNFETRLLINDAAVALGIPWIYTAAVGSYGVTMVIRPGETACLACLLEGQEKPPAFGAEATCDTAGVLNAAVGVIASLEAAEAAKILAGKPELLHGRLISCDAWSGKFQSIGVARNLQCRACARREFIYLDGRAQPHISLCGRDSVQIHERRRNLNLGELSRQVSSASATDVRGNEFLLRFRVSPYDLTIFADGRAIIQGTQDAGVARSLYARYIGA
ncbi:MAG: ThiF family adenylyltransferase [Candidatus Acidiferrales bacterium]